VIRRENLPHFFARLTATALLGGAIIAPAVPLYSTVVGTTTVGSAVAIPQHIVLGFEAHGLAATVATIPGAVHLLKDLHWRHTLAVAIANAGTRFTVVLDGFSGSNPYRMIMDAVQRGATPLGGPTEWEMAQLWSSGRMADVTFRLYGVVVANPFK